LAAGYQHYGTGRLSQNVGNQLQTKLCNFPENQTPPDVQYKMLTAQLFIYLLTGIFTDSEIVI
jgi:hypothetical protein